MTSGSARTGRLPRDTRARERLRRAQQAEAEALAGVCAAQQGLDRAHARRDAAVAAAAAKVTTAQTTLESARAALVRVSGIERAALLLGLERGKLRRLSNAARDERES